MDAILIKTYSEWFDLSTAEGTAHFYATEEVFFSLKQACHFKNTDFEGSISG